MAMQNKLYTYDAWNRLVEETSTLVHVTVNGEIINTTETHLFYVKDKGWVESAEAK